MAYLASSLKTLRAEVNFRWPNRDKGSDGWIGDAAHQKRKSDHVPDAKGCVHALDLDKDGIDPYTVILAAIHHPATEYVVHDRHIWSRRSGMQPRPYTGSNPHTTHIHVSVGHTTEAEDSTRPWLSGQAEEEDMGVLTYLSPQYAVRVGANRKSLYGGTPTDLLNGRVHYLTYSDGRRVPAEDFGRVIEDVAGDGEGRFLLTEKPGTDGRQQMHSGRFDGSRLILERSGPDW